MRGQTDGQASRDATTPGFSFSTGHSLEEGSPFFCWTPHCLTFPFCGSLPFGEDGSAPGKQGYHPRSRVSRERLEI